MTVEQSQPNVICQFPISHSVEGASCYSRMRDAGIDRAIFCSMIYAPYRFVMPRYANKGICNLEEGRYYYQPQAERYSDLPISPEPTQDFAGRDLLDEMTAGAAAAGVQPAAWLTLFANGAMAKQRPEFAVANLYDSRDRLFLCFNNPAVREYSLRICEELVERYPIDELMLDKIPQTCLEQQTLDIHIDPVLRVLGSFCFCKHCTAQAAEDGFDLDELKAKSLHLAAESLAIPPHVVHRQSAELRGDMEAPLLMLDHPWVTKILAWRIDCIRRFLAEARQRMDARRKGVELSVAFVPPVQVGHDSVSPRAWLAAQSYAAYRDSAADRIHCVIHWDRHVVEYNTRRAVNAVADGHVKITTHVRAYGSTDPQELPELVSAAQRGGSDGVAYFCYDLMTNDMIDAVGRCTNSSMQPAMSAL